MKYFASDFWMMTIDRFNSTRAQLSFSSLLCKWIFKMETNILAFVHRAFFILDSLPTLYTWPCKAHSSVIMLSKRFYYKSDPPPPPPPLFLISWLIWIYELVAGYVLFSAYFTPMSCLSVCLTLVEGICLLVIKREVLFDLIKRIQTASGVMIPGSLAWNWA